MDEDEAREILKKLKSLLNSVPCLFGLHNTERVVVEHPIYYPREDEEKPANVDIYVDLTREPDEVKKVPRERCKRCGEYVGYYSRHPIT